MRDNLFAYCGLVRGDDMNSRSAEEFGIKLDDGLLPLHFRRDTLLYLCSLKSPATSIIWRKGVSISSHFLVFNPQSGFTQKFSAGI